MTASMSCAGHHLLIIVIGFAVLVLVVPVDLVDALLQMVFVQIARGHHLAILLPRKASVLPGPCMPQPTTPMVMRSDGAAPPPAMAREPVIRVGAARAAMPVKVRNFRRLNSRRNLNCSYNDISLLRLGYPKQHSFFDDFSKIAAFSSKVKLLKRGVAAPPNNEKTQKGGGKMDPQHPSCWVAQRKLSDLEFGRPKIDQQAVFDS